MSERNYHLWFLSQVVFEISESIWFTIFDFYLCSWLIDTNLWSCHTRFFLDTYKLWIWLPMCDTSFGLIIIWTQWLSRSIERWSCVISLKVWYSNDSSSMPDSLHGNLHTLHMQIQTYWHAVHTVFVLTVRPNNWNFGTFQLWNDGSGTSFELPY